MRWSWGASTLHRAARAAFIASIWLAMCAGAWAQETSQDAPAVQDAPSPPATPPAVLYPEEPLHAGPCPVPPAPGWSESEAWTWSKICAGEPADLSQLDHGSWSTEDFDQWKLGVRRLSANFLRRVLSEPVYAKAITYKGVRIWSAYFDQAIDLNDLRFDRPLEMLDDVFVQPLLMENYRTESTVSLARSRFRYAMPTKEDDTELPANAGLSLAGAQIGMNLVLSGAVTQDLRMNDARIGMNLFMIGVDIKGVADLSGSHIGDTLFADNAQFGKALKLTTARIEKNLRLIGTHIAVKKPGADDSFGSLFMEDSQVKGSLLLGAQTDVIDMPQDADAQPAETPADTPAAAPAGRFPDQYSFVAGEVRLNGAAIGGELSIRNANIRGFLNLQDAHIDDDLWMTTSDILDDDLSGAVIKGFLLLQGSIFQKRLYLDSAEIGRHLIMSRTTEIKDELQMRNAKLNGTFYGEGAHIHSNWPADQSSRAVNLRSATIGGDLNLTRGTTFNGNVEAAFLRVGGSLDLTGGHFASVDLTGARIAAELRLASAFDSAHMSEGSLINLRNVQADSLLDVSGVWPQHLELDGFTYRRFGGAVAVAEANRGPQAQGDDRTCRDRSDNATAGGQGAAPGQAGDQARANYAAICSHTSEQLLAWLGKQQSFSTQPYSHLANMLRQSGDREIADDIIFEGKKKQWEHTGAFSPTWLVMGIEYAFTGFGVHPERLVAWSIVLVLIGFAVFSRDPSPDMHKLSAGQRLVYSLDMLLPVVHLRHHHYEIELESGWARGYLYFHKIMGYVLASLLLAAIAGGHEIE